MTNESMDITLGGRLELYPSTVQVLRMAGWIPPGEPTPEHAACVPRAEYEQALKTQAERHATRVASMPQGMSKVSIESVMASTRQMVVDEIVRAIDESDLHFDAGALSKKLLLDVIRERASRKSDDARCPGCGHGLIWHFGSGCHECGCQVTRTE